MSAMKISRKIIWNYFTGTGCRTAAWGEHEIHPRGHWTSSRLSRVKGFNEGRNDNELFYRINLEWCVVNFTVCPAGDREPPKIWIWGFVWTCPAWLPMPKEDWVGLFSVAGWRHRIRNVHAGTSNGSFLRRSTDRASSKRRLQSLKEIT